MPDTHGIDGHKKIWIERAYDNMIRAFGEQSIGFHIATFLLIAVFWGAQVAIILINPQWLQNYAYTPMLWVAGLLSYLIAAPFLRYSKLPFMDWYTGVRDRDDVHLRHWAQHLIVVLTFIALVIEVYGIATGNFTISEETRSLVNEITALYWFFGLLAGVLAGLIIDLKSLPELIKLCLVTWIAVLAHICWWIT